MSVLQIGKSEGGKKLSDVEVKCTALSLTGCLRHTQTHIKTTVGSERVASDYGKNQPFIQPSYYTSDAKQTQIFMAVLPGMHLFDLYITMNSN